MTRKPKAKSGIAAALEQAMPEAPPAAPSPMQLPLIQAGLDLDETELVNGSADATVAPGGEAALSNVVGAQGAPGQSTGVATVRTSGRPAGARNKRTEEWADYLLTRYRSPLVVLAEIYSRQASNLAKELQCTKAEAFAYQIDAAKALAPYVHQRQPIAVNVDPSGLISLIINADPELARLVNGEDDAPPVLTVTARKPAPPDGPPTPFPARPDSAGRPDAGRAGKGNNPPGQA